MICLGRSHFFRFNHPAEANFMKSVLPNARISMPPISFYPAVDNPEYFHMPVQDAPVTDNEITSGSQNSNSEVGDTVKAPTPLRKTPPTTLILPPQPQDTILLVKENEGSSKNGLSPIVNGTTLEASCSQRNSDAEVDEDISDSDVPPEVPPRSEGNNFPSYVNSSALPSEANFIGEYIYTPAESEPEVNSKEVTRAGVVGASSSVITSNGTTSVHNALYRSLPTSFSSPNPPQESLKTQHFQSSNHSSQSSTSHLHIYKYPPAPVTVVTSPSMVSTSPMSYPISPTSPHYCIPKTPIAIPVTVCSNREGREGNTHEQSSRETSLSSGPYTFNCLKSPVYSDNKLDMTTQSANGNEAQYFIKTSPVYDTKSFSPLGNGQNIIQNSEEKKQKALEDRINEEATAEAEKARLDEILNMFAEYERQNSGGSSTTTESSVTSPRSPHSPYHTLTQNRIKTNGSLPRDKRSPIISPSMGGQCYSPQSPINGGRSVTPSEDELNSIFTFDESRRNGSMGRNGSFGSYPPFPNVSSGLLSSSSPPPMSPRSPYENVPMNSSSFQQNGYCVPKCPRSPRTRIRTTVRDRRDHCEVFENKMAVVQEIDAESPSKTHIVKSPVIGCSAETPQTLPRSPVIDRNVVDRDYNVIGNKGFADVTPNAKGLSNNHKGQNLSHRDGVSASPCTPSLPSNSQHNSNVSSPVSAIESMRIKNKAIADQMVKNIQDTLNIENIAGEVVRLKEGQNSAMKETNSLKTKITELERLENEALRELEMERALVEGELSSTRDVLKEEETRMEFLFKKSSEMETKHLQERERDKEAIDKCQRRLETAENELDSLERKSPGNQETKEGPSVDTDPSLRVHHDALESERKNFEDTEFSHMESEAHRESEREELNQEMADLKRKVASTREKISELESQMSTMTSSMRAEAESLEEERQRLITKLNKSYNSDLADRMAKLHLLDKSQEDLDRIHQVSTSSPLDCSGGTLGRRTSAALMEVEKNRHLTLVRQGTDVIDNERKKMEELKKRAANEVRSQWEEQKKSKEQREVNCASLNSVGSEDSSLTSSDLPTESLSSDEINGQRSSGESAIKVNVKMRQNESITSGGSGDHFRPLSEASSICDSEGQPVRFRSKSRTQQRPLTQYLPVRSEEHFDLRQHILSAGHQIELCPHLILNHTSCRGYLHKLGSKFRTWQKRWFMFDRRQRALVYYSDKNENKVKGGVYFKAIEEVYVDHLHSQKPGASPKLTFCVKTHNRTFHFLAASPEAMRIWIDVIFTGAEGYREFGGAT